MRKYLQVASLEWRNALAYRGDVWLGTLFLGFRVLLAYLLWHTIFGGKDTYGGMTLAQMVTYYLMGTIISPLTQSDGLLQDFSEEIRSGQYAKYIVRPVSPLGYFTAASMIRSLLPTVSGVVILGTGMLLFRSYFFIPSPVGVLWSLVTSVLAAVLNVLIGYAVSTTAFRFTNVGGFYILKHIMKEFLSGSLLPLNLVFHGSFPLWSPFSYMIYYPAMLCLEKADVLPQTAIAVLLAWIAGMLLLCLQLQKRAVKSFEGVGI